MGATRGARPPSRTAYYVALAGIVGLLLLLLCYFFYFCVRRVKELSQAPLPEPAASVRPPPPSAKPKPQAYPVQPGVRESASAMARLCQLPAGAVFPAPSALPPPRVVARPSRD